MGHWLAPPGGAKILGTVKRFDARYWTVNFPRPMMASVVTTGPSALRVDARFYRKDELAGLIWEAEDRWDHPLLAYETARDFRHCRLRFRWRSEGLKPLVRFKNLATLYLSYTRVTDAGLSTWPA